MYVFGSLHAWLDEWVLLEDVLQSGSRAKIFRLRFHERGDSPFRAPGATPAPVNAIWIGVQLQAEQLPVDSLVSGWGSCAGRLVAGVCAITSICRDVAPDVPNSTLAIELPSGIGDFFKLARMVPVMIDGGELVVATTDPLDVSRLHALELATGLRVTPVLAREKEIAARIEALYSSNYAADGGQEAVAQQIEGIGDEEDVAHLRDMASEVPVIRLVNQMLVRALESRASDVHIEPFENQLKVRYRIDGILHEVESPPRQLKGAVISRLKILAQLNIAERRLPQDGRIKTRLAGKDVDLRIATVPTLYGESVVIRLLERGQIFTELETMGFPPEPLVRFNEMILKPHGMILVTGPTGSGKTTTLYGALQKLMIRAKKSSPSKILRLSLSGVIRSCQPQIGLTFANACVRSCARIPT